MEVFVRRHDRRKRKKQIDKISGGGEALFRGMHGYTMRREGRVPESIVRGCALRKKEQSFAYLNVTHYSIARSKKSFESCFEVLLKQNPTKVP
jgi:hypothetical protein